MSDKKFNVGDKVRYIGKPDERYGLPNYGDVGYVVSTNSKRTYCKVVWKYDSFSYIKHFDKEELEMVIDMTNEMLKPKMEKNGLNKKMGGLHIGKNLVDGFWVYSLDDVHNAIALAYKVGYLRSQKGRPFKIGEKKKKGGHWEPIDPNNLPKEGTKVRYSREIDKDYNIPFTEWSGMKIGDETVVMYAGLLFGVRDVYNKFPNSKFVSCNDYPSRFDMWVEDDE